ncbi:MAG: YceI family protein, partial [Bdellovibrionales bacterium]|nr:YceI family protein [Bdellovibrionales bacterium]
HLGPWNLPATFDDSNTVVTFQVASSIHTVKGTTSHINGHAWLESDENSASIRGGVKFPVRYFNTGNESRDRKLRSVMAADRFPDVVFVLDAVERICNPTTLLESGTCSAELKGTLTIRGSAKKMRIPVKIVNSNGKYIVSGTTIIDWSEYQVEDPSTFIAKLSKEVLIEFQCTL